MSNVKERIIGAVTIMSEEEAEKVWNLIQASFALCSKTADADDISETASFLYPLIFSEEIPCSFNRRSR